MRKTGFVALLGSVLLAGFASIALAGPTSGSAQGGFQSEAIDIDSDSCFPLGTGGPIICIDSSSSNTGVSGQATPGGKFLRPGVAEGAAVPGVGCSVAPTQIQSCTINGHTNGCAYTWEGGSFINNYASGSLLFEKLNPGGSLCIDFNSPSFAAPYSFTFSSSSTYTGGTGTFAGATGNVTTTGSGEIQIVDAAGHEFGWSNQSFTGTINLPK